MDTMTYILCIFARGIRICGQKYQKIAGSRTNGPRNEHFDKICSNLTLIHIFLRFMGRNWHIETAWFFKHTFWPKENNGEVISEKKRADCRPTSPGTSILKKICIILTPFGFFFLRFFGQKQIFWDILRPKIKILFWLKRYPHIYAKFGTWI